MAPSTSELRVVRFQFHNEKLYINGQPLTRAERDFWAKHFLKALPAHARDALYRGEKIRVYLSPEQASY